VPFKAGGGVQSQWLGGPPSWIWNLPPEQIYGTLAQLMEKKYVGDQRVFRCPSLTLAASWSENLTVVGLMNSPRAFHYQYRGLGHYGVRARDSNGDIPVPSGAYAWVYWVKASKMPGKNVMIADSIVADGAVGSWYEINSTSHRRPGGVPAGGNTVHFDGSVRWRPFKTLANPGSEWYNAWGWEYAPTDSYQVADQHSHFCAPDGTDDLARGRNFYYSGGNSNEGNLAALRGSVRSWP